MARMKLYGEPGWGSVLVEAQLVWYGLDYDFERVGDLFKAAPLRQELAAVNPLAQIPTLVMEDGTVMTESAAITLRLADLTGNDTLVPGPKGAERQAFLRWLIFLVANVYPTYTYADDPSRFVARAEAREGFETAVRDYAKRMYAVLESQAGSPWFLGERFSALDIYVCTMSRWRPRRAWFAASAPKLFAIATATEKVASLQACWQRNFPNP
ncbi:MAG TPA: glutathione S-transferase family protein [Gammaproteobacteria bacterium]